MALQKCLYKLTNFIQRRDDYPELNIPKLDPYTSDSPFVINLRRSSLPINLVANCSNISIHGLDKIEIVQIKGIAPNLKYTTIEANVFVPAITLNAGYTSNSNLFLLRKTTEGVTNVNLTNVEAPVIMDCDIIEKDGKEYLKVKSIQLQMKVSNFSMAFETQSLNPTVNTIANKVINANWKRLKAEIDNDLELYIGDVIKSIIVPITEKIAIQDLLK